jgi:carboxypeptidase Taq
MNDVGVLQDVHWGAGLLGYFPSYTLGAMIAAQLFEAAENEMPDIRNKIRRGDFGPIREWLRKNIHEVGSLYESPDDLLIAVTGKPLDPQIFIRYIEKKYKALYGLD